MTERTKDGPQASVGCSLKSRGQEMWGYVGIVRVPGIRKMSLHAKHIHPTHVYGCSLQIGRTLCMLVSASLGSRCAPRTYETAIATLAF